MPSSKSVGIFETDFLRIPPIFSFPKAYFPFFFSNFASLQPYLSCLFSNESRTSECRISRLFVSFSSPLLSLPLDSFNLLTTPRSVSITQPYQPTVLAHLSLILSCFPSRRSVNFESNELLEYRFLESLKLNGNGRYPLIVTFRKQDFAEPCLLLFHQCCAPIIDRCFENCFLDSPKWSVETTSSNTLTVDDNYDIEIGSNCLVSPRKSVRNRRRLRA